MPPSSVYVTFDRLDPNNGAGKVCIHEIKALSKVTNLQLVLCREGNLEGAPVNNVNIDAAYGFNPYLYDYFMADRLEGEVDLAHLSCSPGNAILHKLRPKHYVCNIVAHDLALSIDEHIRMYNQPYPFIHNTDPYLHSVLIKHAKNADVVFCPSSGSKEWIIKNIAPKRVEVIPHGCDFPEKMPDLPDDKLRLGYLGAFGPDKGLIYLLMAWKALGYKDAELVFGGSCCDHIKPWVDLIAPGTNIRYTGFVKDPADFFKEVNVVCAPSVSEGFGLLVIEGPAHGRPCISTTGTGAIDVLNKRCSIIVPPRDPKGLRDAIAYFHDNPSEIKKWSKEARKQAGKWKWKNVEDKYSEVYQEVLA